MWRSTSGGFAAEVKSWWDTALAADASELDHFSVEEQVEVGGSQKRSDLTVLTATGEVRLAGELRLPDHREHDKEELRFSHISDAQVRGNGARVVRDTNSTVGDPLEHRLEREGETWRVSEA